MYILPAFRETDLPVIHETMQGAGLANLVTATANGLVCTPLPLFLDANEGDMGTLYGHVAKANPQWKEVPVGEALAIFMGPDAYVTPSWYEGKSRDGKVVPTWNYVAVHACGPIEFFEDADRLLDVVTRLTNLHEASRRGLGPSAMPHATSSKRSCVASSVCGCPSPGSKPSGR
jgi:transcriptional regulator